MGKKKSSDEGLPYFKFFPGKWANGNIDDCSLAAQGLFINLCVKYWGRRGDITLSGMKSKFKRKEKQFAELISRDIVKVIDDRIQIIFLDEQLIELGAVSEVNSKNAQTRWNQTKQHATASNSHSDGSATVMLIEEKRREENRREENTRMVVEELEKDIEKVARETKPKPLEQDEFEPLTEPWFSSIFDELYLEQKAMAYKDHDIADQLTKFKSKVRGAPADYIYRDTPGIRNAFDYQLRNTKPQRKYAGTKRTLTETSPTPGTDYTEGF